jgi:BclB C-terminal domain-containing protein
MSKHWEEKCNGNNTTKLRCDCTTGQSVTVHGPVTPGPSGPPGSGSIIPYASGFNDSTGTGEVVLGGIGLFGFNIAAILGFGSSTLTILSSGTLTLDTGIPDFAFVVPRPGTVTSISAFISVTDSLISSDSTGTVRAELWRASAASNTFTPTGVFVDLAPTFGSGVSVGDTAFGSADAALPVSTGDKLLMVFSLTQSGTLAALIVFASAGVAIS